MTPASLLYRLRKPDETSAWDRFVELYSPLLYHWARQLGCQQSDGADLVQDVFVILWQKMPEFEYDSQRSFHAWLKTIFLNRYRSLERKRIPLTMESGSNLCDNDAEITLDDSEDNQYLLRKALQFVESEFSELQQKIFHAYVLEQRTPHAVAASMGVSVGTVYAIKSKILSRLRQEVRHIFE
ncbi:MAG: sigma-70 family RNA polymerase sigma factor [Pirellulaceae bacterium]|nr:sigma-70 family RNA polymerase sigma factor [Pirellulaceae bacterium]